MTNSTTPDTSKKLLQGVHDMAEVKAKLQHLAHHMPSEDPFMCTFAAEFGERLNPELVPVGFNITLELLLDDMRQGKSGYPQRPLPYGLGNMPRMLYSVLSLSVDRIIKGVCPPAFAEEVIRIRTEIRAQIDAARAAEEKANPKPKYILADIGAEDASALYASVRRIADIWFECLAEEKVAGGEIDASRANDPANSFYNRTASGLYVEWYYGTPSEIWTPWGKWHLKGGASYSGNADKRVNERFMKRVELREHMPVKHTREGIFGPVYAVVAIDGKPVPEARVIAQSYFPDGYQENRDLWMRLTAEYDGRHALAPAATTEPGEGTAPA